MYGRCGLWEEPVSSCGSANQGWETTRPRSEVILAADKNYDDARRVNHHVQPLIWSCKTGLEWRAGKVLGIEDMGLKSWEYYNGGEGGHDFKFYDGYDDCGIGDV